MNERIRKILAENGMTEEQYRTDHRIEEWIDGLIRDEDMDAADTAAAANLRDVEAAEEAMGCYVEPGEIVRPMTLPSWHELEQIEHA